MPGEPILVGDLVDVPLVGVAPGWPIDKALTLAAEHGRSVLPVLENHEFFGVVSFEPQLVLRLLQANRQLTVAEAMEKEVPWLEAQLEAQGVPWEESAFWAVRENGGFRGLVRRERALMALHYNSAYFPWKEIADELPVGVVVVDASERVCLFNRVAKRILALEEKAVVGARLKEVLPDSRLCEVLETGRARFGYKYKIGEKVIVANHVPMQINGWRGAVSVFQDVSEIEQLSGQLE
ncbi:MAG: PAS domain-containing protein, partial [Clostridia bacterium]|nr:PAS domain-containing protein [Clostridia bacterium]